MTPWNSQRRTSPVRPRPPHSSRTARSYSTRTRVSGLSRPSRRSRSPNGKRTRVHTADRHGNGQCDGWARRGPERMHADAAGPSRPWPERLSGDVGSLRSIRLLYMGSSDDQRPIWDLVEEAAAELDSPMTTQDILDWFTEYHRDVLPNTLRSQVAVAVGNSRSYLNHPVYSRRPPLLWSVGRGRYEPYDLERHGEPRIDLDAEEVEDQTPEARPPVWQLIAQAARELVAPFSLQEVVDWFEDHYPDIPPGTVRTQVSDWSGNSPSYIFNAAFNRRRPVLWRVARGQYEPYDERRHGEVVLSDLEAAEASAADSVDAVQEFVLEQYLEEFLFSNWNSIDFGRSLELWSPDDRSPRQFDAFPAGRVDFLARDLDTDALVVIELKRATPSDAVVGQALRYMGWVKDQLASPDQRVEGIILAGEADQRLLYAASMVPALRVVQYRIDFRLESAD